MRRWPCPAAYPAPCRPRRPAWFGHVGSAGATRSAWVCRRGCSSWAVRPVVGPGRKAAPSLAVCPGGVPARPIPLGRPGVGAGLGLGRPPLDATPCPAVRPGGAPAASVRGARFRGEGGRRPLLCAAGSRGTQVDGDALSRRMPWRPADRGGPRSWLCRQRRRDPFRSGASVRGRRFGVRVGVDPCCPPPDPVGPRGGRRRFGGAPGCGSWALLSPRTGRAQWRI